MAEEATQLSFKNRKLIMSTTLAHHSRSEVITPFQMKGAVGLFYVWPDLDPWYDPNKGAFGAALIAGKKVLKSH